MVKLILTRGIPASGKTTWAVRWVAVDPDNRVRVNRDDLRANMYNKYHGVDEQAVTVAQHAAVKALLKAGKSVVVDDTNLKSANVKTLMKLGLSAGAEVEFQDFEIDVDAAYIRDKNRTRSVGLDVIMAFESRYLRKGKLPPVPVLTDAPVKFAPYEHVEGLPAAILVDIDGTLAHMTNRGPYDTSKYADDAIDPVIRALVNLHAVAGYDIVVMSGRDAAFKDVLVTWLNRHGVLWNDIYMRPEGDTRNDAIVKNELYERYIKGRWNVPFILDDRNRVVEMWRDKGMKVLQVAEGDF